MKNIIFKNKEYLKDMSNILKNNFIKDIKIEEKSEKNLTEKELYNYWIIMNSCFEYFNQDNFKNINFKVLILAFNSICNALEEKEAFLTIGTIKFLHINKDVLHNISKEEYIKIKKIHKDKESLLKQFKTFKEEPLHAWITTKDGIIYDPSIINILNNYNNQQVDLFVSPLSFLEKNEIEYIPYDILYSYKENEYSLEKEWFNSLKYFQKKSLLK